MRVLCVVLGVCMILCGCAAAAPVPETAGQESLPPQAPVLIPASATVPPDPVAQLLQEMTVEEKVGQLFLARCPDADAISDIDRYHLGGYILFAQDFENQTPETLTQTLQAYQQAAAIPMLIAVDEEGGAVCRVSAFPAFRTEPFPSPRELYAMDGLEMVLSLEIEKGYLLSSLGINVNLGPVCDITTNPRAFMYRRSLGEDTFTTGNFAIGTVDALKSFQVGAVLKHFPGYGDNTDTHTGIAVDERSIEQLEQRDLIPFSMAILAGCDAIMVSHTIVNAMDPSLPATLSPAVHSYLRDVLGFGGVIVTDDLYMDAIRDAYGPGEAAVLAVLAGNDLICSTEYAVQYQAVLEAVQSGRIPTEQLDASVERILRWKHSLGLLE